VLGRKPILGQQRFDACRTRNVTHEVTMRLTAAEHIRAAMQVEQHPVFASPFRPQPLGPQVADTGFLDPDSTRRSREAADPVHAAPHEIDVDIAQIHATDIPARDGADDSCAKAGHGIPLSDQRAAMTDRFPRRNGNLCRR